MTIIAHAEQGIIHGCRILVAEDEYVIVQETTEILLNAGAEVLGPVPSVHDAEDLIAAESRIHPALLDVNLGNEAIWTVVDHLLPRQVPLVLATSYDANAIPPAYVHLPRCEKPISGTDLIDTIARTLRSSALAQTKITWSLDQHLAQRS